MKIWIHFSLGIVIHEATIVDMPSSTISNLMYTWNTTGVSKGNYTLSAYAQAVSIEDETTDNTFTESWVIVAMFGDITGPDGWPDGRCDMRDIGPIALHFGQTVPPATPNCDVVYDLKIDMRDIGTTAKHFGTSYTPSRPPCPPC